MANAVNQIGWNIFCNRRLILSNDTSEMTGWRGKEGKEEVRDKSMLPKYHNIYNEFRGLVFLNSNNPFTLPLNTSKTNLNPENKNYNYILNKMVLTARPIIDFLSGKYDDEKQKEDEIANEIESKSQAEGGDDQDMIEFTEADLKVSEFKPPKKTAVPKLKENTRISYLKNKKIVDAVANKLKAKTGKEVGEKTFDYFVKMEEISDE